MLRNTYLYENRMFTSKVKCIIIWGVKGTDGVTVIKSLICVRVGSGTWGLCYYRPKRNWFWWPKSVS